MNKKTIVLIAIALGLAAIYAIFFTDWFRPNTIRIFHTTRVMRVNPRNGAARSRLMFGLGDTYSLTEVKVVPLAALQTNKFAPPVWHLVSDEGSDDVDRFFYGEQIRGMDPGIEGARAEPLQPGVTYRLFVTAGKIKGRHDFQIGPAPTNAAAGQ